jgi:demethylmenaquinone methyltransferase / 2-methoxy-6-polyprenyl-1,4-benzoquinol methylase
MFDGIAPTYDALNRVLSLGIDQSWRKRAVKLLGDVRGRRVIDLCAGTLDLSEWAERYGARVVASDFSSEMLRRGRGKAAAPLVQADALKLPFADASFAGALCGFGLRNLPDPLAGLCEARRVLAPGARLVVLDFFRPRRLVTRAVQALYNQRVLPLVGGVISGDRSAYEYLARSIDGFVSREQAESMALRAGFSLVYGEDLTAGVAALVVCQC